MVVEGLLLADVDVDDDLGEDLEVGDELGEGLAAAVDDVEEQERGEDAVAGGAAAGEDDVAGLLAAERCAGGEHLLEDVLVADGGAEHFDAAALECGFEAHVGHGGGDDGGVGEEAAGLRSRAARRRTASPLTTLPFSSAKRARSASPSKVMPMEAFW